MTAAAPLSRSQAAAAVEGSGFAYVLATYQAAVPVTSTDAALQVARAAVEAAGPDADDHLRLDLRPDRVELTVQTVDRTTVTAQDVEIARAVHSALAGLGFGFLPVTGVPRPVQALEIGIDTLDRAAIRPFWKAVLGYVDEPREDGPSEDSIVDPARQGPCIWFQQMDEPRPQRNRIHFDITVPADEAPARIQAALDAGGVLVSDAAARSFWILADAEGNEVCVCTWQDRERG